MLTCWWRYSLKFSLYSQYLSSRCQLMPFLTHYHILLFFRNFWQGKLPPITQHEQISMSNWNLKNWLTVGKLTWQPRQQKHLGFFYVKVIVYLTPQETTSQTMRSTSGNCQKNKSNYKQTQIINHHWSISAFLELQESQIYCSRAPNNKLSQLFKQYHFSLQLLSYGRCWPPYSIYTFVISGVM